VSGIRWKVERVLHRSWQNARVYLSDENGQYFLNKVGSADKVEVSIAGADELAAVSPEELAEISLRKE
jgi:hypothetical protein